MESASLADIGIDLGKTSCRARLVGGGPAIETRGVGSEGFAEGEAGVSQAVRAVEEVLSRMPAERLANVRHIGVGAAGVDAAHEHARNFATVIAQRYRADVTVVSDALAAHAGALGGTSGTVLIAGTGAVALHLSPDGTIRKADGWGIWLGDLGSGRWIGQEGLRRTLRARDGIGGATSLAEAARATAGSLAALPEYVSRNAQPARALASFAPAVFECADQGDVIAAAIVSEAIDYLVDTAAACTRPGEPLAVVGGLTASSYFRDLLTAALRTSGLTPIPPQADAVSGATAIGVAPTYPHERSAIRVRH